MRRTPCNHPMPLHRVLAASDVAGMLETKIWVFLGLMTAVALVIPFVVRQMKRRGEQRVVQAFTSLAATGVVVENALDPRGRPIVRIWGALDHPVALDLRIAPRRKLLGGSSAGGAVDPHFDRCFRILSRQPDLAVLVVSPEIQHRLSQLGKLEFRLGSCDSLLPPEYRQPNETKLGRRLRRLWMMRVPLERRGPVPREELAEAGRLLARSVAKHCLPPGAADLDAFRTGRAEGQWL